MSLYAAQSALETDYAFQQRVRACVVQETNAWASEPTITVDAIVREIMPNVAAAPGFAELFLYGDSESGTVPGQSAILDGEILSTVQPMLNEFKPVVQ